MGPWCAAAGNFGWATHDHFDEHDYKGKGGYCWVVATGKWKGGNLFFRQLGLEIQLEPGTPSPSNLLFFGIATYLSRRESGIASSSTRTISSYEGPRKQLQRLRFTGFPKRWTAYGFPGDAAHLLEKIWPVPAPWPDEPSGVDARFIMLLRREN